MEPEGQVSPPSREAVHSATLLYSNVCTRFPRAVEIFESRWTSWQEVCLTSSAATITASLVAQTEEYDALKRLGPKIVPFVVSKLARDTDQNSYGVFLYNALENDPDYRANLDEPLTQEDLQRHGSRIVELNYQRTKVVQKLTAAWDEFQQSQHGNSTLDYTNCDEYWDLLDIGTSIIAHIMVAFADSEALFWYELLHEIMYGRKRGAIEFQPGVLRFEWYHFFNEGEHDQGPEHIRTGLDLSIGETSDQISKAFREDRREARREAGQ